MWGTAVFASFTTFGHHRPLNAIILVGLVLVGNMGFTFNDQLTFIVIFSLAALLLLIRFHALDEETEWVRRRIGEPRAVSTIYLRGGTAFIAIAVVGSLVLTQTASSAPLAGTLRGFGDQVIEWGRDFERFLPSGGAHRTFGISFGAEARISESWNFAEGVAVRIEVPDDAPEGMYWRAATYDEVQPRTWRQRERLAYPREINEPLLDGGSDQVTAEGREEVTFRVVPDEYTESELLSPMTPLSVDQPVRLSVVGTTGFFATMEGNGDAPYTITAIVPVLGDEQDPEGLTANRLRAASRDYPVDVSERFLTVPDEVAPAGGHTRGLLAEIMTGVSDPENAYEIAIEMQRYLRSSEFDYSTDLRGLACDGLSTSECFASTRVGFCQQYATTMVVMLRMAGIPARYASGFLPSTRVDGVETIEFQAGHAWVEAYFPGYGWVQFDPTGGSLPGQIDELPDGEEVEPASPAPSLAPGASAPIATRPPLFEEGEFGAPVTAPPSGPVDTGTTAALVAVALLLFAAVAGLAFFAWQRGSGGDLTPDRAYGALTRMAGRLGFGPRANQTVYEFAGALGDVLPQSRPEIQTVAQAKVEVAYGRRALGADRMAALGDAQRRLRVGLLRLLLRRGDRKRRRR
jgi:transglutaminase-like putative cysteine protease